MAASMGASDWPRALLRCWIVIGGARKATLSNGRELKLKNEVLEICFIKWLPVWELLIGRELCYVAGLLLVEQGRPRSAMGGS
ncbi:hypothetical protein LSTR_LSTR007718 [Laodelphax striatellus]|uniref:Uncharacterized protein n=1 Tax=Laodelphax striatellus TaxID=195883 RepID=A0A482XBS9_LAOST|nr:hypothetical protein LSTR_LSTR007718 [Laodelphax striatellus]